MILDNLRSRCVDLDSDVKHLVSLLKRARTPPELRAYKRKIIAVCLFCEAKIQRIRANIDLGRDDLAEDILSDIQQSTVSIRLINTRFATPILRISESDRLSLSIVNWLHSNHEETKAFPPAISDGSVSVWPAFPQVYMFPQLEKRGLLYQSLLFHEFGHVLYYQHKQEMDDLVAELQRDITNLIFPLFQRNDRHSKVQANHRQVVVDTWYLWAQEIFCDAVGFTIGGPSFVYAFSSYLSVVSRNDFYRHPKDLELSGHPVTWLRVHFLANRARANNFRDIAESIEDEWRTLAKVMGVKEDYHGYYDKSLEKTVLITMENMLAEAEPRPHTHYEIEDGKWKTGDTPVKLLNLAWFQKKKYPASLITWEENHIKYYLEHLIDSVWLEDDIDFEEELASFP